MQRAQGCPGSALRDGGRKGERERPPEINCEVHWEFIHQETGARHAPPRTRPPWEAPVLTVRQRRLLEVTAQHSHRSAVWPWALAGLQFLYCPRERGELPPRGRTHVTCQQLTSSQSGSPCGCAEAHTLVDLWVGLLRSPLFIQSPDHPYCWQVTVSSDLIRTAAP